MCTSNQCCPSRKHQTIARELFSSISSYIKLKGNSCEPFFAPFAVFLNKDDTTYVDPEKNRILVYNFETEDAGDYTFTDSVKAGIYDDLLIDFSNISVQLNR